MGKTAQTERWTVDDCPDAHGHFTIRPDDGTLNGDTDSQPIATVYAGPDAADLAAAAPELLETCERVADELQVAVCSGTPRDTAWLERRLQLLRAVIAKAKP